MYRRILRLQGGSVVKKPTPVTVTDRNVADLVAELHTLRSAIRQATARERAVSAGLEAWLRRLDDPAIDVEGYPTLRLKYTGGSEYDLRAMAEKDPETLIEWALAGAVRHAVTEYKKAVGDGRITRSGAAFRSPRGGTSLRFEREEE